MTNGYPVGKAGAGNRTRLTFVAHIVRAFAALCLLISAPLLADEDWHYSNVDRIVAVSDVHGAYDALVATLRVAKVIDAELSWSGGTTHFVITGDLLDRGPDSRLVMDLIMRLEVEAPVAGGKVHQLLGNHEVMNLIGDLRYVADEEYAAFLDMELPEERELWYREYRRSRPVDIAESKIRSEFDALAPPGYFGHRNAFRRDGHYGRWLLEKPITIVINDTVFVHGGIPPFVMQHGLTGVNVDLKNDLSEYMRAREVLVDEQFLSPIWQFKQSPSLLADALENESEAGEIAASAQAVVDLSDSPLHGPEGPTWYRGTAVCSPLIEADRLNASLEMLGADRVVVGHTPTLTRRVQQRLDGRIIEIDTGMLRANYRGSGHALVIEGDQLTVVNQDGTTDLPASTHPIQVGFESRDDSEADLVQLMLRGTVGRRGAENSAGQIVPITDGDRSVFAYFSPLESSEGLVPDVAAYRLDRLVGLGMVPVTVVREIDGRNGTLQLVAPDMITEKQRAAGWQDEEAHCAIDVQIEAMRIFDALINNPARSPSTMLYQPDDWQLILVGHQASFGRGDLQLVQRKDIRGRIGGEWRRELSKLDDKQLRDALDDVLDSPRLKSLMRRRDALLYEDSLEGPEA